jgi:hypothetical protein
MLFFIFQSNGYWKKGKLTTVSPEIATTEKPRNLTDHRNQYFE